MGSTGNRRNGEGRTRERQGNEQGKAKWDFPKQRKRSRRIMVFSLLILVAAKDEEVELAKMERCKQLAVEQNSRSTRRRNGRFSKLKKNVIARGEIGRKCL